MSRIAVAALLAALLTAAPAAAQDISGSIFSPADNAVVRGTIAVSATVNSINNGVCQVEFFAGPSATLFGTDTHNTQAGGENGTYTANLDTTTLTDGSQSVSATAWDAACNGGTYSLGGISIQVDNTAPQVAFTSGPAEGATTGTSVSFGFSVSDGNGIATVECALDFEVFGACSSFNGGAGQGTHNLSGLSQATHKLRVRTTDTVGTGNSAIFERQFVVDATAPTVFITNGPPEGSAVTGGATFSFGSDDGAATFACRIIPDGGSPAFGACSGPGATHSTPALAPGGYAFEVRATDAVGNPSVARRGFTVPAPTPTPTPGPGATPTPTPGAGPPVVVNMLVVNRYKATRRYTTFSALTPNSITPGATLTVTCKGKGCPIKSKTFTGRTRYDLTKTFRKKRLRVGVVLEFRASAPGATTRSVRFTIRPGKAPKVVRRCLAPGATKPTVCP